MKASFLKRIGAYLIDYLLIAIVCSLFAKYLPNYNKIEVLNKENESIITEYAEVMDSGNPDDLKEISKRISDYNYELKRLSISLSLLSITTYALYFIVFQRYNNGQTVGKKLLKLEVVSDDDNNLSLKQTLIRSIILYPIVFELVDIGVLLVLNKSLYLDISSTLSFVQYVLFFVCCVTALFGRGLHDKLAHTNVIVFGTISEEQESSVSKWKKNSASENEVKTYRVNHTSRKRKE